MADEIEVVTFDCYGTLVDWEGGAAGFLYELALRHGEPDPPPGPELRRRWEALQFELVTTGAYRPYKQVLAESLERFLEERGASFDSVREGEALVRSMRSWQAFPDTAPALGRARSTGVRLVIVSNTDRDIVSHTLKQLDVGFDDVVTAEDVGAYKPAEEVFRFVLERLGTPPERVLHTAFGFKYDIGPAARLGMRTAWVNRHVEPGPPDVRPDYVWRDLWGLPDLLAERGDPLDTAT